MAPSALTSPDEDFPRWYQDVVAKAEMADNGPVRGTMVIRPYGYAIWERMQAEMDWRIKRAGAQNAYFPIFIPESYFAREAEHVEGFSPELAVVTHAGGEDLTEPIVVRPTSETVIGEFMAKWIQSYRDLPLALNQWANVVRWELRPRLFLRSTEFLWQEGHTAHASYDDAHAYALTIHHDVYDEFLREVVAAPTFLGIKPPSERFAGAVNSLTGEGMMRDGKALQMVTTHELGQNFSRVFDIVFQTEAGGSDLCFTTSWGASTRLVGGLVMMHGDENGLVVPPRLAPIQAVVLCVRDDAALLEAAGRLGDALARSGVRVELDRGRASFGRRVTDWEIKGVPVRVEIGPRDLEAGQATLVRRDTGEKEAVTLEAVPARVAALLEEVQHSLFERARRFRDERTVEVGSVDEAAEAAQEGFARLGWSLVNGEGEARLREAAITVRCLQRADGSVPESADEEGLVCIVGKSY
ncbi:MAG TPA: proline--tRNA ligase [Acidimicrobiales bacterium]|nr:MAG: proline--tRNA ligase [Actinobacteria bacterium 21-73-9]HQU26000.1 proline--tRNA ligase [Acidimicrobiales bacterium]